MEPFFETTLFSWVVLPILIFIARILDVSLGTVRIIFVSRGMKLNATILGFFEILIWISVIGQVLQNLTNPLTYIAYAAGFAAGNYIGILIEQKLSIGKIIIRIITSKDITELRKFLESEKLRYTLIDGSTRDEDVSILLIILDRKKLSFIINGINKYNPSAFYSIEDVRRVREGGFPESHRKISSERPMTRKRNFSIIKKK